MKKNNSPLTKRGLFLEQLTVLMIIITIIGIILLTGCISQKKYNLLMQDFQNECEKTRSLSQELRILQVEYELQKELKKGGKK